MGPPPSGGAGNGVPKAARCRPARKAILVIEDDEGNAALFKDLLEAQGYDLEIAGTGPEALERIAARRPDLIVTDIVVPGLSGLELIRMIKDDAGRRDIPVLAVTSLPERLYKDRIMAAGCDAFVSKPFSVSTLWSTVRHLLAEQPAGDRPANPLSRFLEGGR